MKLYRVIQTVYCNFKPIQMTVDEYELENDAIERCWSLKAQLPAYKFEVKEYQR